MLPKYKPSPEFVIAPFRPLHHSLQHCRECNSRHELLREQKSGKKRQNAGLL